MELSPRGKRASHLEKAVLAFIGALSIQDPRAPFSAVARSEDWARSEDYRA